MWMRINAGSVAILNTDDVHKLLLTELTSLRLKSICAANKHIQSLMPFRPLFPFCPPQPDITSAELDTLRGILLRHCDVNKDGKIQRNELALCLGVKPKP